MIRTLSTVHVFCFSFKSICIRYVLFNCIKTKCILFNSVKFIVCRSNYSFLNNATIRSSLISYPIISGRVIEKENLSQELGCIFNYSKNFIMLSFQTHTQLPHKSEIYNHKVTPLAVPTFDTNKDKINMKSTKTETHTYRDNNNLLKTRTKTFDRVIEGGEPDFPEEYEDNRSKGNTNQKSENGKSKSASKSSTKNSSSYKKASTYRENSAKLMPTDNVIENFDAEDGSYDSDTTPLYLMNGSLFNFSDTNSFLNLEFENVLYKYQFALQSKSQYDIERNVNKTKFIAYIKCLVESLELYFFLKSVIQYTDEAIRGNRGLIYIRERIKSEDIDDLNTLKNLLQSMYVNPNLVNFIKFMHGNYSSNTSKFSPIIKLCPSNLFLDDINNKSHFISDVTIKNKTRELREFYYLSSIFKRFNSEWNIDLSSFDAKQKYNSDFLSFWHNNAITFSPLKDKSEVNYSRVVDGIKSDIYIGLFSDSVKGQCVASIAIKEAKTGIVETGIFTPCSDYPDILDYNNRVSLHVFNRNFGIVGIRSLNDAVMSFLYATPYINSSGRREVIMNKFQSKEALSPSLLTLRKFVHQTIHYVFL